MVACHSGIANFPWHVGRVTRSNCCHPRSVKICQPEEESGDRVKKLPRMPELPKESKLNNGVASSTDFQFGLFGNSGIFGNFFTWAHLDARGRHRFLRLAR